MQCTLHKSHNLNIDFDLPRQLITNKNANNDDVIRSDTTFKTVFTATFTR